MSAETKQAQTLNEKKAKSRFEKRKKNAFKHWTASVYASAWTKDMQTLASEENTTESNICMFEHFYYSPSKAFRVTINGKRKKRTNVRLRIWDFIRKRKKFSLSHHNMQNSKTGKNVLASLLLECRWIKTFYNQEVLLNWTVHASHVLSLTQKSEKYSLHTNKSRTEKKEKSLFLKNGYRKKNPSPKKNEKHWWRNRTKATNKKSNWNWIKFYIWKNE